MAVLDGQSLPPLPGAQLEAWGEEVVVPGQFSPSQGQSLSFPGIQAEVVAVQGFPPQQLIPIHGGRVEALGEEVVVPGQLDP